MSASHEKCFETKISSPDDEDDEYVCIEPSTLIESSHPEEDFVMIVTKKEMEEAKLQPINETKANKLSWKSFFVLMTIAIVSTTTLSFRNSSTELSVKEILIDHYGTVQGNEELTIKDMSEITSHANGQKDEAVVQRRRLGHHKKYKKDSPVLDADHIESLTYQTFGKKLLHHTHRPGSGLWIVFYKPSKHFDEQVAPILNEHATTTKIAAVNCASHQHHICRENSITDYPTIRWFQRRQYNDPIRFWAYTLSVDTLLETKQLQAPNIPVEESDGEHHAAADNYVTVDRKLDKVLNEQDV